MVSKNAFPDVQLRVLSSKNSKSVGDALREVYQIGVLRDDFVLVYGDVLSTLDIGKVIREHIQRRAVDKQAIMTVVLSRHTIPNSSPDAQSYTLADLEQTRAELQSRTSNITKLLNSMKAASSTQSTTVAPKSSQESPSVVSSSTTTPPTKQTSAPTPSSQSQTNEWSSDEDYSTDEQGDDTQLADSTGFDESYSDEEEEIDAEQTQSSPRRHNVSVSSNQHSRILGDSDEMDIEDDDGTIVI